MTAPGWPDALGSRDLDTAEAYQALEAFAAEYGREPLLLLLHAAVPETLRADLLHLMRINFLPGCHDPSLEADVLLAPLTRELGNGYYRIEPQVRWHALIMLASLTRDEARPRDARVAELVWRHLESLGRNDGAAVDADLAEYIEVQRWVALAYLDPRACAAAFAQALNAEAHADPAARLRLGGLAAAIELPLAGEPALLAYARGLDALVSGNADEAARRLRALGREPLYVGGVVLRPAAELLLEVPTSRAEPSAAGPPTEARQPPPQPFLLLLDGQDVEGLEAAPETAVLEDMLRRQPLDVRTSDRAKTWSERLRLLLLAQTVVIDLRGQNVGAYLWLGLAWGLRPQGVVAFDNHRSAPDGVVSGIDLHTGTSWRRTKSWETLQLEAIEEAIAAPEATPPYALCPELTPPEFIATPRPVLPARERRPHTGLVIGNAWTSRPRASEVTRALQLLKIEPQPLTLPHPVREVDPRAVEALATAEFAFIDWSNADRHDFLTIGLRLALKPATTVVGNSGAAIVSSWWPRDDQAVVGAREAGAISKALESWLAPGVPRPNWVYLALPDLQPPRWNPRSVAQAWQDLTVVYPESLADIGLPLARTLYAAAAIAHVPVNASTIVALIRRETVNEVLMPDLEAALGHGRTVVPVLVGDVDGAMLPTALRRLPAIVIGTSERREHKRDETLERVVAEVRAALGKAAERHAPFELQVRRPDPRTLRFDWLEPGGGRHSETRLTQPELLGTLFKRLTDERGDADAAAAARALLLPASLTRRLEDLDDHAPLRLVLDAGADTLPWERLLLQSRRDVPPSRAVVRIAEGGLQRPRPLERRVLLVGAPRTDGGPAGDAYSALPGAEHEVRTVAERLGASGLDVELSEAEDAAAVVTRLLFAPWRVLLLAGHGIDDPSGTAGGPSLVLSGGARLGPRELAAMREAPELLVANVEWMGNTGHGVTDEPDLKAMAQRQVEAGTACVVAPDGSVDDAAAAAFSIALFDALCGGHTIEVASAAAREAAWRAAPGSSTWAAYRVWCVSPDWQLRIDESLSDPDRSPLKGKQDSDTKPHSVV